MRRDRVHRHLQAGEFSSGAVRRGNGAASRAIILSGFIAMGVCWLRVGQHPAPGCLACSGAGRNRRDYLLFSFCSLDGDAAQNSLLRCNQARFASGQKTEVVPLSRTVFAAGITGSRRWLRSRREGRKFERFEVKVIGRLAIKCLVRAPRGEEREVFPMVTFAASPTRSQDWMPEDASRVAHRPT